VRGVPRGIRARSATAFAVLALLLSIVLSVVTYELARWYLLDQRQTLATRQAMINALVTQGIVAAGDTTPDAVVASLSGVPNAKAVLRVGDAWYTAVVELGQSSVPESLVSAASGAPARQRAVVGGSPYIVVGVPLQGVDAVYFEFLPLSDYVRTLDTLAVVLIVGASITTVLGAGAGWVASRKVLRPLSDVADAARAMSAGELDRRLHVERDPDLQPVAESFNDMADSLQQRIERELRFTADVSHELRTPLTSMGSAVNLAKRANLTGRAQFAIEVLDEQVDHLRRLTLELLEISRIDAGVVNLVRSEVDVEQLVTGVLAGQGVAPSVIENRLNGCATHPLDATRFEWVVANLVENADRYGGGVTAVVLDRDGDALVVTVDDAGPGVPEEDRVAIFGRFHRGAAAQPIGLPKGTGLGLSLVDEHVKLHGGTVTVDDAPGGGARFVVVIPRST
jgi:two-component system, OmpR family, sensor histidine kinase MtrB